jgi:hypothetical protein
MSLTIYEFGYVIQNPNGSDFESKKKRVEDVGRELYADGGTDAMENMFNSIEYRIKDEIGKDAKPYRSWLEQHISRMEVLILG